MILFIWNLFIVCKIFHSHLEFFGSQEIEIFKQKESKISTTEYNEIKISLNNNGENKILLRKIAFH